MYDFDSHNRMVDRYNASREVSRPDTSNPSYYSRYNENRHNNDIYSRNNGQYSEYYSKRHY